MTMRFYCLLFFCLQSILLAAQSQKKVVHIAVDYDTTTWRKDFFLPTKADTVSLKQVLDTVRQQFYARGFLETSVDSVQQDSLSYTLFWHIGKPIEWLFLENGNLPETVLDAVRFRPNAYQNKPFRYTDVLLLQNKIIEYAENHGYPFAYVYLSDIVWNSQNQCSAKLYWQKGDFYTFGNIRKQFKVRVTNRYLEQILDLRHGTPYNEAAFRDIQNRLKEIPFVEEKQNAVIEFKNGKAQPVLFLTNKKAGKFDFLLGLQPNSSTNDGKLLFTGNILADLPNLFGNGERLRAEWRLLRPRSPELKLKFALPFVLKLPIGVEGNFENYKRDTVFTDLRWEFGLSYRLIRQDYIKVFWQNNSTNLLTINEKTIIQTKQLPAILDVAVKGAGAEYHTERLDYRLTPRKGYSLTLRGTVGQKSIEPSSLITNLTDPNAPNFDFSVLYDTLAAQSYQYRSAIEAAYYLPLRERSTLKIAVRGASVWAAKPLYTNELYRVGGFKTLRGFDEDAFFASAYSLATLEYRFLLGGNSYLYAFADGGYLEQKTINTRFYERPLGVGGGITIETKAGMFGVALGFGRQSAIGFDFRAAKVHFGYEAVF